MKQIFFMRNRRALLKMIFERELDAERNHQEKSVDEYEQEEEM